MNGLQASVAAWIPPPESLRTSFQALCGSLFPRCAERNPSYPSPDRPIFVLSHPLKGSILGQRASLRPNTSPAAPSTWEGEEAKAIGCIARLISV